MDNPLDRREFLKATAAAGGALTLEFSIAAAALARPAAASPEVTHWIVIHPDDRVVVRIARSELGQGSFTGLAQLVAEELECDWSKVSAEYASPNEHVRRNRVWGTMATGGSTAIRGSQEFLRRSGASAREMLVAAAAAQWKVPASECTVADGVVTHGPSKRRLSYGKVAAAAAKMEPPKEVRLKEPGRWKVMGRSMRRLEAPDKVLGKPVFATDVQLPGMLHASIVQSPVFLGKVKRVDGAEARKMRGVKGLVKHERWVAVVADNWWRANEAAKKLAIEWDNGPDANVTTGTIFAMFRQGLEAKWTAPSPFASSASHSRASGSSSTSKRWGIGPKNYRSVVEARNLRTKGRAFQSDCAPAFKVCG